MTNIIDTLKQERLRFIDGHVSVPIFEAPKNYSCYHDSAIDEQIVITLPDDETDQLVHPTENT